MHKKNPPLCPVQPFLSLLVAEPFRGLSTLHVRGLHPRLSGGPRTLTLQPWEQTQRLIKFQGRGHDTLSSQGAYPKGVSLSSLQFRPGESDSFPYNPRMALFSPARCIAGSAHPSTHMHRRPSQSITLSVTRTHARTQSSCVWLQLLGGMQNGAKSA